MPRFFESLQLLRYVPRLLSRGVRAGYNTARRAMDARRGIQVSRGGTFFHGGLPSGATLDAVDILRNGTKQSKFAGPWRQGGVGFYMGSEDLARKYTSGIRYGYPNASVHMIELKPEARVARIPQYLLPEGSGIRRLTREELQSYMDRYDAIQGFPWAGGTEPETILLNKDAVKNFKDIGF